ncbi:MAG: carboxypeptidase-like regulatory domain-containing protein, partial [Rikenellaceae bacterium]
MKNILKAIFVLTLTLCGVSVRAQNIEGIVLDSEDNPLVGATIWWANTTIGDIANLDGEFSLRRVKNYDLLIASFVGFKNDTIRIEDGTNHIQFNLMDEGLGIDEVVVRGNLRGNYISNTAIDKKEMISFAGLCKMACCNLAESFENSAAVTVGYSDAISGARQIKMLGLAGIYTQILDESRPIMRGIGSPYGLSYTPGMWLNSIQVSKGVSSVTA